MKDIHFTSQRTNLKALIILGLVGLILLAAATLRFWALRPLHFSYDYLSANPNPTGAEIVRFYFPRRLVQPEWVSRTPDWFVNWSNAETTVRCVVVVVGWGILTGALICSYVKVRKKMPNTALEPA